jgi:23S rRNA pseudouridine955/2504/2580 synthase
MSRHTTIEVQADDAEARLDRWFARHYPAIGHGALQKLLRTGQVRIDGKRAKANTRLETGQQIRVPPQLRDGAKQEAPRPRGHMPDRQIVEELRARVLYRDDDIIAIDKPHGLAVQGGTGQSHNLDALSEALRFEAAEPPRLVHRLDKDTSGVLVMARHARAAARLTRLFRDGGVAKVYWAVVVGVPSPGEGTIDRALSKQGGAGRERMAEDPDGGQSAITRYRVIARAGRRASWLGLSPLTGRTHQIRAHCVILDTPIVGDGKYGGQSAYLSDPSGGIEKRLHLHARELVVPHPDGGNLRFRADLPDHMRATFAVLGFDPNSPRAERDWD